MTTPYQTSTKKNYQMHLQIIFWIRLKTIRQHFNGKEKYSPSIRPCTKVPYFKPLTEEQVLTFIQDMNHTTCATDPCNSQFLMKIKHMLIVSITKIINSVLTTGQYLEEWKITVVWSFTKRPNLDMEYKTYCPISDLTFNSKLIDKAT